MIILNENAIEISTEYEEKCKEYMDYIDNHVLNVIQAYIKYFVPLTETPDSTLTVGKYSNEEFITAIKNKAHDIKNHDMSKYNDLEFYPYRRHWHPTKEEENCSEEAKLVAEESYQNAWKHHYEHNMHHIEYWYDFVTNTPKDMDLESIIEMICDWTAMSYQEDKTAKIDAWWNNQNECYKERSMMTPDTINTINDIYKILTK